MSVVQRWVIGTAEGCHIRITGDVYVSPQHAAIVRDQDGQVWVMDGGSTNGTYLVRNGQRSKVIGPTSLQPGDTVIVGRTSLPWSKTGGHE